MKYYIKTFGCQQNVADSQRIAAGYRARGWSLAKDYKDANVVVINTCMVRSSAQERIYGLLINLAPIKTLKQNQGEVYKIILTGCLVGALNHDKSGFWLKRLQERFPHVDQFLHINEVGFELLAEPETDTAFVVISNGCNNFCSYCIVPYTRGREVSRPLTNVLNECKKLKNNNVNKIMLLGQNVNSYGYDLIVQGQCIETKPVYVKYLGRKRIPTLFPKLLEQVAQMGFSHIDFMSANPWDFSSELIDVIAKYPNITRQIHLPVQSGDAEILQKMNRWYTPEEYLDLIDKIRKAIPEVKFTTDIIVGYPGETDTQFENTLNLVKSVGFERAYIAMYSPRPFTHSSSQPDDVPHAIKKERWLKLDKLINAKFRKLV